MLTASAIKTAAEANKLTQEYEVIVIGAGIAGSAAAYALGTDGRKVLLIERDWKEPDRIVGELLQPGGVDALKQLGLQECIDGIDGIDCHGYAVIKPNGESVLLPYPKGSPPAIGRSLHHGRLIMNLRKAARTAPNVTCIEGSAVDLITDSKSGDTIGVVVNSRASTEPYMFKAPLTVVADGCFSRFRKQFISTDVVTKSHFVGFIIKDCPLPHMYHGHVILANPAPILMYQIGTHDTRILIDIPGQLPSIGNGAMKKYMCDVVGPQLPDVIQPSFYAALKTERIRSMPNGWLPPSRNKSKGVVLVGDAINMRHPLTGGGMTVAFADIIHLRDALCQTNDLTRVDTVLKHIGRIHWQRKYMSSVVNILANALYELFSAGNDPIMKELQDACFAYFQMGGRCASTPVGLLAGLIHEPWTLIGHFFAVAFYGMLRMWIRGPIYMFPVHVLYSFLVVYKACIVIFPLILAEMKP
ncbi:hypothetical protein BDV3_000817 [Batrachochytrium dendrobatidis]|nr:Squalene epoxidase [Batrachochytrium dendrobatidis]KAK5671831.1 Squalene epoxidase [Batrachochytrium dendrobatidis]